MAYAYAWPRKCEKCVYLLVEVCEGAPVAVGGWVLTDRHDLAPLSYAANSLLIRYSYIYLM